jgi:hypothetical protein
MATLQIDDQILASLRLARDQLAAMIEESDRCRLGADSGLPAGLGPSCEHCGHALGDTTIKDAIRPFLETWALFPFDVALAAIRGEARPGDRTYLAAVAAGEAAAGAQPARRSERARIAA